MVTRKPLTRADALKELKDCYAAAAECQERYLRVYRSQYGYIGRQTQLEDALSDAGIYSDRIGELEAFLASEVPA